MNSFWWEKIIYFSGRGLTNMITAVAVDSPFSFALLEFTHFQSHREGGEFVRRPAWGRRRTHGFHVRSFLHLDLEII